MATKWYLAAMCALSSVTAFAQTLPTDVELRASFCMVVVRSFIEFQQAQMPLHTDPDTKAAAVAALGKDNDSLRKLQLYLVPRLPYLDATALLASQASANGDLDRVKKAFDACAPPCKSASSPASCSEKCVLLAIPDIPNLRRKWDTCRDLSWLPI
jgi:hypothetical protein